MSDETADKVMWWDDDALPFVASITATATNKKRLAAASSKAEKNAHAKCRFKEINAFIDYTIRGLTKSEMAVWFVLWRDCKPPNGEAQTSRADIARRSGISLTAVKGALRTLKEKRLIFVEKRGNNISGQPSIYSVLPTTDANDPPTPVEEIAAVTEPSQR